MAVGLSLWYTITAIVPFIDTTQKFDKVPCLPDYFPNDLVQLVMKMIHPKSDQRPTAEDARSALEKFEDDEGQMTHFEVAYRQFRQVETNLLILPKYFGNFWRIFRKLKKILAHF